VLRSELGLHGSRSFRPLGITLSENKSAVLVGCGMNRFRRLIVLTVLAAVGCLETRATLIIVVHPANNSIYLASDSSITGSPEPDAVATKIARVSSNCCVAIAGVAETRIINTVTKQQFPVRLFDVLTNICDHEARTDSCALLVTNITSAFAVSYASFLDLYNQQVEGNSCLLFVGFDELGKAFGTQCVFNRTNHVPEHIPVFKDGLQNGAGPFTIYGEPSFAYSIARSPEQFSGMHAERALENVRDLYAGKVLSDEQMAYTILELFRLHRVSFQTVKVGPPYVIYKLTKASLTKLR
jgi:hypothetical protein